MIVESVQVCVTKLGQLGVDTFFVISGFLITQLLLNEANQTGSVSLAGFYVRRATRILPAMLIYVLTAMVASAVGLTRLDSMEGVKAVTFLCNTSFVQCAHTFRHFWTLGIEEQFYLLWPLLLVMSGRFRVALVALTMVVAAICAMIPSLVIRGLFNNGLAVYCLSSGVLFALSPKFRAAFAVVRNIPTWALLIPLELFPVWGDGHWHFGHPLTFLIIPPILVSIVLARDGNIFGPQLSEAIRKVGLVSYSIYIWDSFGMWPYVSPAFRSLSVLAMPFAWISYRYIELPCIAMGRRWSKAIIEARYATQLGSARTLHP
jgi:peptidoglycan/LPS O-acetylase OafA/YrhL